MLILTQDGLTILKIKKANIKRVELYKKISDTEDIPYDRFRIVGDDKNILGDYMGLELAKKTLLDIGYATEQKKLYQMPEDDIESVEIELT